MRLAAMQSGRTPYAVSVYFELTRGAAVEWTTGPMDHPTPVVVIQPSH